MWPMSEAAVSGFSSFTSTSTGEKKILSIRRKLITEFYRFYKQSLADISTFFLPDKKNKKSSLSRAQIPEWCSLQLVKLAFNI